MALEGKVKFGDLPAHKTIIRVGKKFYMTANRYFAYPCKKSEKSWIVESGRHASFNANDLVELIDDLENE
jgi:hypothetical protein